MTRWLGSNTQMQFIVMGTGIVLGVAALGGGFMWYRMHREDNARQAFVQAFDMLENARSEKTEGSWNDVEQAFRHGFNEYRNSSLAGYFLVYESQALLEQGNHDQACAVLEQAIDYMPYSQLYDSYSLRLALMQIDATDPQLQERGYNELKALAYDEHNALRSMALYYYGLYYYNQQDRESAQTVWNDLFAAFDGETSPWVERAQAKLEYRE